MASDAQLNANRINGAKSHGALSPETQKISSRNSYKHGLCAKTLLIPDEDRDAYLNTVAITFDYYKPANAMEDMLVQEIADTQWKLLQVPVYEASVVLRARTELKGSLDHIEDLDQRNAVIAADAQHHCSKTFLNLSLQQTRAQRHLEKKIAEFKAMRDERELVQKLDADRAMDSILGEKAIPLPTVGVVFSREYLIARVAFRHHNKGADLRTFDRYWGDPKAKVPAYSS